jgi:hypothetical protein
VSLSISFSAAKNIVWWGEMAPPLKGSLNLSNSSPMLRALMYVASLQTFGLALSSYRRLEREWRDQSWAAAVRIENGATTRLIRMNLENTDLIYRLLLSVIWVVFVFCLLYAHCTSDAYTATYPTVLTIVHLNGTSILSFYNSTYKPFCLYSSWHLS